MGNKVSEHGGFFNLGTISHGTLRPQDLLRTFAAELERLLPFNGAKLANEGREFAERLDTENPADPVTSDCASEVLCALQDELQDIAAKHGAYFGTTEGDGSDFGFWPCEECEEF